MDAATTFNREKSGNKAKRNRTSWKPGQSGNVGGRPKDDESWSGIIRKVGNMTPEEILEFIPPTSDLGKAFRQYPKGVQMKWSVILRVFAAQMFEPNGVMTRELMDRLEGRVPFRAEFDAKLDVTGLDALLDAVYATVIDAEEVKELEDGSDNG